MNLAQLTTRLNSFSGFDLTDTEAKDLLNEARRRFALRSKYPRKRGSIGLTVAGQSAYDWPEDLLLPLGLSVAGTPWPPTDADSVERFERSELALQQIGGWYDAPDVNGARKLYLYPAPGEAGLELKLEWVFRPTPLVDGADEPTELPEEFHPALLPEVASYYYETVEDDPELAQRNAEKADQWVVDLRHYENLRRVGSGVFKAPILGIDA